MIKPTIGRVMWYWPQKGDRGEQPWAAIVVKVWGDNMVNLVVFDPDGESAGLYSVPIVQDGSPHTAGDGHYVEWMPYQIGQAKKNEESKG
jgi:hypothetical protein